MAIKPSGTVKKRKSPRRRTEGRVGILIQGSYFIGQLMEIGEGGAMVKSLRAMEIGQRLLITLHVPGITTPCFVIGRVSYQNEDMAMMYGIQFDKIEFTVRRVIRNYVASSIQH